MTLVRLIDVVLVLLTLPVLLLAGAPALGVVVGAAAWVLNRGIGLLTERRAEASGDPRTHAGVTVASMLGRAWITGLAILAVGLGGERADGAAAAAIVLAAFSVYLAIAVVTRPGRTTAAGPNPRPEVTAP